MKAYAVIIALAAAGTYAYMHPDTLNAIPGLHEGVGADMAGTTTTAAHAPADRNAIFKCTSHGGQAVFSNHPCENGDTEQAIKLSASTHAHLPHASATGESGQHQGI